MRYAIHLILFIVLVGMALSGCSTAQRAFSRGEQLESNGKYEEAMYSYAEAFRNDPEAGEYRIRFFKAREKAADIRYKQGNLLFDQGDYAGALAEYQAGLGIDPVQGRFDQLVEKTSRLKNAQQAYQEGLNFEKTSKLKEANLAFARALELDPKNREYQLAQARILGLRKSKLEGFDLSLKSAKPITLKFKDAKLKDVFYIVTQLSGINFIFDEAVKDQPVTVYLENATFQQALDLLTNMFKLGRKVANESTVIIYPRTPEKTKQYEDMVVRTFNLNYMEAKKAINLIRTLLQVRKIYVNEDSNSLVVRDTNDVVSVVEKILEANDVPDAEVILEVEVIEIGDTDAKNVGTLISPYSVQMGAYKGGELLANTLSRASTSTSTGTTTTSTDNTKIANLVRAFVLQGYAGFVTVPNAQFDFAKTLGKSEVLSNPKLRVKNREKAKFNVGKRIPITTTNTTNTTVSVNVQYIDVGVKLNVEPTIQPNNEITIKLGMEVSQQVGAAQTVGGSDSATTVVTIGTRNLDTVLSLKDGETSVIGGLMDTTYSNDKSKVFLLGEIPLLGELLTHTNASKNKTELMLAITPRLVRSVTVPQNSLASFVSGKEDDPALSRSLASFDQEPVFEAQQKPDVPQLSPQQPAVSQPGVSQRMGHQTMMQQPAAPPQTTAATVSPSGVSAQTGASVSPPMTGQDTSHPLQQGLLQIITPAFAIAGQQFTLNIKAGPVDNLIAAPFNLTYDPSLVEFVAASEGGFLKKDGTPTIYGSTASPSTGSVSINLTRAPGSAGISGEGILASLVFRAKKKGVASFGFTNAGFSTANGKVITVLPFSSAVEIK